MIKETGTVIRAQEGYIWVETSVKSTCSSCAAKSNCGTSAIAEAVAGKTVVNKVKNNQGACVGDSVEIGIPEETLLLGSFYIYMLPLITAILFALAGSLWLPRFIGVGEGLIILLTLIGGLCGFVIAKLKLAGSQVEVEPQLLKVVKNIQIKEIID